MILTNLKHESLVHVHRPHHLYINKDKEKCIFQGLGEALSLLKTMVKHLLRTTTTDVSLTKKEERRQ